MKAGEAIRIIDDRYPNDYSAEDKYRWLKQLEGRILKEVFETHEDEYQIPEILVCSEEELENAELSVPDRFAENIYVNYLQSKLNYWYHEIDKYNDAESLFMNEYDEFRREYNREHMPKSERTYL